MKPIYKYLIAATLGGILSVTVVKKCERKPTTSTVTQVDTTIVETRDSTGVTPITPKVTSQSKPVVLKVPNLETTIATDSTVVNTTLYKGKEELDNGTIDYEIYADNLVATSFELTTKEKVITKTVTNTVVLPAKSRLFITGGIEGGLLNKFKPQAASAGLMYIRRQKWGVGAEIRHDFSGLLPPKNATTVGIKVNIGL